VLELTGTDEIPDILKTGDVGDTSDEDTSDEEALISFLERVEGRKV